MALIPVVVSLLMSTFMGMATSMSEREGSVTSGAVVLSDVAIVLSIVVAVVVVGGGGVVGVVAVTLTSGAETMKGSVKVLLWCCSCCFLFRLFV